MLSKLVREKLSVLKLGCKGFFLNEKGNGCVRVLCAKFYLDMHVLLNYSDVLNCSRENFQMDSSITKDRFKSALISRVAAITISLLPSLKKSRQGSKCVSTISLVNCAVMRLKCQVKRANTEETHILKILGKDAQNFSNKQRLYID